MTLKCDLHTHIVFSDGLVWPTVRVEEAWREGLDAISITDHIKYQPHKHNIPTNFNRSYEIALAPAGERDILLIKGTEITGPATWGDGFGQDKGRRCRDAGGTEVCRAELARRSKRRTPGHPDNTGATPDRGRSPSGRNAGLNVAGLPAPSPASGEAGLDWWRQVIESCYRERSDS
jgi:hypothetical protein